MEVGNHRVGQVEVVGREDELVCPSLVFLQVVVGTDGGFHCALHCGSNGHHLVAFGVRSVHLVAAVLVDEHLFGVHFVLREVFHVG